MRTETRYVLEDSPEGRSLVVVGPWSKDAAAALARGEADGLVLNYARGFSGAGLDFLDDDLGIRRLDVLDRGITDLTPIARLGDSLEDLSVQAAPSAELDLAPLEQLHAIAAEWALIRSSLGTAQAIQNVITWQFDERDLHAFRDHVHLIALTIKEAPNLESLSGAGEIPGLRTLSILLAEQLRDISDVTALAPSLTKLRLQNCPAIRTIEDVASLTNLRFLGLNDCGDIPSFGPIGSLDNLETLHAWGSTRVADGDLSPLARLPHLTEVRMRDRRSYRPSVADLGLAPTT
jgi:hypothetical protein